MAGKDDLMDLTQALSIQTNDGEANKVKAEPTGVLNLAEILSNDSEIDLGIWGSDEKREDQKESSERVIDNEFQKETEKKESKEREEKNVSVSKVIPITKSKPVPPGKSTVVTEWAEVLDVSHPIDNFHELVPQMAHTWPFELDAFQKQAIIRLERNESVFVAAHTSAGKTVVAEYAIALSKLHMTRTIYTSPIKALSNQKFRDFKDTFEDVGLITGDIQINQTATCLIMTTEILRSMLYNGSEIIQDLEYVIFDEVHYINDRERGVVWEEVFILLPEHINIIMLSATVPNTLDFADWVGRTKRKKIYVISTPKRPVPLEHFLYTGSNAKTKNEMFLLQDASGQFLQTGYKKAVTAKKERESKSKQKFGAKGIQDKVSPQQEKNIWLTLVNFLSSQEKLPVVAFTLSRNRCDQNADMLTSLDLTTAMEKSDIHHFIQRCISRLKGSDQKLPQVVRMTELLKRGIGVHHSGILPILKEVIEMLFQKGWVKLLFATETFAMGVNMPARTVVFDNIRKHDGMQFRTLLPAEYIQMAGRAGRRGLDSTGTVIILCKNDVFEMSELYKMMQGKPQKLESQFRLTYSMILNLLRVEKLRVEDMMKRSFREVGSQKKVRSMLERLKKAKEELDGLPALEGEYFNQLNEFYDAATKLLDLRNKFWTLILNQPGVAKILIPGRMILVRHGETLSKIGMLLKIDAKSTEKKYSVLVFKNEESQQKSNNENLLEILATALKDDSYPTDINKHEVIQVTDKMILDITNKSAKIDGEKVMNDVKKREIPRFKDDPPGPTATQALKELLKVVNLAAEKNINFLDLSKDLKIFDMDLQLGLKEIDRLKRVIAGMDCETIPDFRAQFEKVFERKSLLNEIADLEYLSSEASLEQLPEYHQHVKVLKKLNYIDEEYMIKLKGKVACEISNQELIITELVLDNVFTDLPPPVIAALLSCMVFEQKKCSEPELTEELKAGIEKIKACAEMIGQCQKECGFQQAVKDFVEQYNFGLTEVVYNWAKGTPFSEITQLTDVQEGVIVRTIQRLDETLRTVKDAARVIGDATLYQKLDETSEMIKRDIVFAASLYTE